MININAKDLINWGELSRQLSGSRMTIRRNKIPKKHQKLVNELLYSIEDVFKQNAH